MIVPDCDYMDEEPKEEPPVNIQSQYREGMLVTPREDGRPPEPPEGFTIYTQENGVMILRRKRVRNLQKLGTFFYYYFKNIIVSVGVDYMYL